MKNKSLIEMEKNLTPLSKTNEGLYKGGFAEVPVMPTDDNLRMRSVNINVLFCDCRGNGSDSSTTTTTTTTTQSPV